MRMSPAEFINNEKGAIGVYMHGAYCAEQERGIQDIETEFDVEPTTRCIRRLPPLLSEHPSRFFFARGREYGLLYLGLTPRNLWDLLGRTNKSGRRRYEEILTYRFGHEADLSYLPMWVKARATRFQESPYWQVLRAYRSRTRSGFELIRAVPRLAVPDRRNVTVSAWSNCDFAIAVYGEENIERLENIYRSFQIGDIAIWLGGGTSNPFGRPGLAIAIHSEIPDHVLEQWHTYYSK